MLAAFMEAARCFDVFLRTAFSGGFATSFFLFVIHASIAYSSSIVYYLAVRGGVRRMYTTYSAELWRAHTVPVPVRDSRKRRLPSLYSLSAVRVSD